MRVEITVKAMLVVQSMSPALPGFETDSHACPAMEANSPASMTSSMAGPIVVPNLAMKGMIATTISGLAAAARRAGTVHVAESVDELTVVLAGCQLGITACALALGAVTKPAVKYALTPLIADLGVVLLSIPTFAMAGVMWLFEALIQALQASGQLVGGRLVAEAVHRDAIGGPRRVRVLGRLSDQFHQPVGGQFRDQDINGSVQTQADEDARSKLRW